MSKVILLLLSCFLIIGLYTSAVEGCDGKWCHPSQGYGCCSGYRCSSRYFQGNCLSNAAADQLAAKVADAFPNGK